MQLARNIGWRTYNTPKADGSSDLTMQKVDFVQMIERINSSLSKVAKDPSKLIAVLEAIPHENAVGFWGRDAFPNKHPEYVCDRSWIVLPPNEESGQQRVAVVGSKCFHVQFQIKTFVF
jgi:hypothetical protein